MVFESGFFASPRVKKWSMSIAFVEVLLLEGLDGFEGFKGSE
jgi:hypothetical protein